MATTSLWRVKGYIGKLILYATNPDKTKKTEAYETGNDDTDPEQALEDVLSYVGREEATDNSEYVYGFNCGVESAKRDMLTVKKFFKKKLNLPLCSKHPIAVYYYNINLETYESAYSAFSLTSLVLIRI